MIRALRNRNYRLFFGGQGVSLVGTWMQRVALSWLVYHLTGSARWLGAVDFAGQIPILLLAPFTGVLADRWDRRRVLIQTQSLALLQAALLAILTLTGLIQPWHVLGLSFFIGLVNAFDMPVRQSFLIQMVEDPADLGNAIALNSFLVNAARLIGPSIGGLLIILIGEGYCFLLNALSFVGVIVAYLLMRVRPCANRSAAGPLLQGLWEGLRYSFGFPPIRSILLLIMLGSLVAMPYTTLLPIFARDILYGGPRTLGGLMSAFGIGALLGTFFLASRENVRGLDRIIAVGAGVFGTALVLFSFSRVFWLSFGLMIFAGLGMMLQLATSNTILQTLVEEDKRGRVMSLYAMAFFGLTPLGSLWAGAVAQSSIGAPWTLMIGGVCLLLGAVTFAVRLPAIHRAAAPLLARKGIIAAEQADTPE